MGEFDWTKLEPFVVQETGTSYTVVIKTEYIDAFDIETKKWEAQRTAVETIVRWLNVVSSFDDETRNYAVNRSTVSKWFLEERKDGKLLFLVTVPTDPFNEFESIEDPNPEYFVVQLESTYREDINSLADIIEFANSKLVEEEIKIHNINLLKASKDLRVFINLLDSHLSLNVKVTNNPNMIKLYLDDGYKIQQISVDGQQAPIAIPKISEHQASNPTTIYYLLNIYAMLEEYASAEEKDDIFTCSDVEINEKNIHWLVYMEKYTYPDLIFTSGKPLVTEEDFKKLKTPEEKNQEDILLGNPAVQVSLLRKAAKSNVTTEDEIFLDIPFIMDMLHTFEDAYYYIIHKYGIYGIINEVMLCMIQRSRELLNKLCRLLLRQLPKRLVDSLLSLLTPEVLQIIREEVGDSLDDSPLLRTAILNATPEEMLCAAILALLPGLAYLLYLLASCQAEKLIPTIPFQYIPTFDILETIITVLEEALIILFDAIFKEFIKGLLQDILINCRGNPKDTGFPAPMVAVPPEILLDCDFTDRDFQNFIDDLSLLITPKEMCSLFNGGTPSVAVRGLIQELLNGKYPEMWNCLGYDGVLAVISSMSEVLDDYNLCGDNIREEENVSALCELNENARKQILSGRMSPEQIEEQISALSEDREERLNQLVNIVQGNNNIFDGVTISFQQLASNNLQNESPMKYADELVVDTIYKSSEGFHDSTIRNFQSSYKNTAKEVENDVSNQIFETVYYPCLAYAWKYPQEVKFVASEREISPVGGQTSLVMTTQNNLVAYTKSPVDEVLHNNIYNCQDRFTLNQQRIEMYNKEINFRSEIISMINHAADIYLDGGQHHVVRMSENHIPQGSLSFVESISNMFGNSSVFFGNTLDFITNQMINNKSLFNVESMRESAFQNIDETPSNLFEDDIDKRLKESTKRISYAVAYLVIRSYLFEFFVKTFGVSFNINVYNAFKNSSDIINIIMSDMYSDLGEEYQILNEFFTINNMDLQTEIEKEMELVASVATNDLQLGTTKMLIENHFKTYSRISMTNSSLSRYYNGEQLKYPNGGFFIELFQVFRNSEGRLVYSPIAPQFSNVETLKFGVRLIFVPPNMNQIVDTVALGDFYVTEHGIHTFIGKPITVFPIAENVVEIQQYEGLDKLIEGLFNTEEFNNFIEFYNNFIGYIAEYNYRWFNVVLSNLFNDMHEFLRSSLRQIDIEKIKDYSFRG